MGKLLIINGADFSVNGTSIINYVNVIPLFQANALSVGNCLSYSGGTINYSSNSKRVGVDKTTMPSGYTSIRFKAKSGFEIALALFKSSDPSVAKGTDANGDATVNGGFQWVSPNKELIFNLSDYDIFAFNVRYDDNTTEFTSNTLTNYFDYIDVY